MTENPGLRTELLDGAVGELILAARGFCAELTDEDGEMMRVLMLDLTVCTADDFDEVAAACAGNPAVMAAHPKVIVRHLGLPFTGGAPLLMQAVAQALATADARWGH